MGNHTEIVFTFHPSHAPLQSRVMYHSSSQKESCVCWRSGPLSFVSARAQSRRPFEKYKPNKQKKKKKPISLLLSTLPHSLTCVSSLSFDGRDPWRCQIALKIWSFSLPFFVIIDYGYLTRFPALLFLFFFSSLTSKSSICFLSFWRLIVLHGRIIKYCFFFLHLLQSNWKKKRTFLSSERKGLKV